jgi:hypothetical protein
MFGYEEQVLEKLDFIIAQINNLTAGFQFVMYVLGAFLVWKVITVLWKLFGGIFFGGL